MILPFIQLIHALCSTSRRILYPSKKTTIHFIHSNCLSNKLYALFISIKQFPFTVSNDNFSNSLFQRSLNLNINSNPRTTMKYYHENPKQADVALVF